MTTRKLTQWDRDALALRCPQCRADPAHWCRDHTGKPATRLHAARIAAARPHWNNGAIARRTNPPDRNP